MSREESEAPMRASLWEDQVIEEIRAARRRLWEESGRDIRQYIARSREAATQRDRAKRNPGREAG